MSLLSYAVSKLNRLHDRLHGSDTKRPTNRALGALDRFVSIVSPIVLTREQRKRHEEMTTKMQEALEHVFGETAHEYAYLQLLCTDPAAQGRGFGSALIHAFNEMVRTAWVSMLSTTNAHIGRDRRKTRAGVHT